MSVLELLAVKGMKLLIAGAVMLVGAVAIMIFSDFNPAQLFIGGGICAFLGLVSLLSRTYERGAAVSVGDGDTVGILSDGH